MNEQFKNTNIKFTTIKQPSTPKFSVLKTKLFRFQNNSEFETSQNKMLTKYNTKFVVPKKRKNRPIFKNSGKLPDLAKICKSERG